MPIPDLRLGAGELASSPPPPVVPIEFFREFQTRAEDWIADYLIDRPSADPEEAYRAYKREQRGRGGRSMSRAKFVQRFGELQGYLQ